MISTVKHHNYLIYTAQVCDHIPLVATVSNLAQALLKPLSPLIIKCFKKGFFHYLDQKSYKEIFLKMIPIVGQWITLTQTRLLGGLRQEPKSLIFQMLITKIKSKQISFQDLPFLYRHELGFVKQAALNGIDVSSSHLFDKHEEIYVNCIKAHPHLAYKLKNLHLQNVKDLFEKAPQALLYAPAEFFKYHDLMTLALQKLKPGEIGQLFYRLPYDTIQHHIRDTLKINGEILGLIPKHEQTKQHVLDAVGENGLALRHAAHQFRMSEDVIKVALDNTALALAYVPASLLTQERFENAVAKDPLAWMYGTKEVKKDYELHLRSVMKNAKSDPVLFRKHSGCLEDIIIDMSKQAIDLKLEDFHKIPHLFLFKDRMFYHLFHKFTTHEAKAFMGTHGALTPAYLKAKLAKHHFNIYTSLDSALKQDVERSNLSGSCVSVAPKHFSSSDYRIISGAFMISQHQEHLKHQNSDSEKGKWQDVFEAVLKRNRYAYSLEAKYRYFQEETSFPLSPQGEALKLYFKQCKQHLSLIAGYLKKNPSDDVIYEHLMRGFGACAGGLLSELAQIAETYCGYEGQSSGLYRVAKIINDYAARQIEATALETYHNTSDVHNINRLRKEFERFFLEPAGPDALMARDFSDTHIFNFFSRFNATNVFQEIYERASLEDAFIKAIFDDITSSASLFTDVSEETINKATAELLEIACEIKPIKELYNEAQRELSSLGADLQSLIKSAAAQNLHPQFFERFCRSRIQELILKKVEHLSDKTSHELSLEFGLECDFIEQLVEAVEDDRIDLIKKHPGLTDKLKLMQELYNKHKPLLHSMNSKLLVLKSAYNLNESEVDLIIDSSCDASSIKELMHTKLTSIKLREFLESARDEDGVLQKRFLLRYLDSFKVFVSKLSDAELNPYSRGEALLRSLIDRIF